MSGSIDPVHTEIIVSFEVALDDILKDERMPFGGFPCVNVFPF